MPSRHRFDGIFRATACALILLMCGMEAYGQSRRDECVRQYQPRSGQEGKDVVWVPTEDKLVTRILQMADVQSSDLVFDLGAGDGKIAIVAARRFGATAVGVEYNPDLAKLAQCFVRAEGLGDKVKIIQGDIFETDFSNATVVTLYLLPELNMRLRPTLLKMKPGTRVVSNSFLMDDWRPDNSSFTEDGAAHFWLVPAQVAGSWTFKQPDGDDAFTVQLEQTFQRLKGTVGPQQEELTYGELKGAEIILMFSQGDVHTRLKGAVDGDRIDAQVTRNDKTSRFIGTRRN